MRLSTFLITDCEFLFTNNYWFMFCYHLWIKWKLSITFHSQTNDQTEHQNQTLEQYFRIYCNFWQDDWVKYLSSAEFAYNNTLQSSIKIISFYTLYGQHSHMSFNIENNISEEKTTATNAEEQQEFNEAAD